MNIGLWKATSEKGTEYYRSAKNGIEINGVKYRVSLFINQNKKSEKSPDMSVVLTEINENTQNNKQEEKVVNEFDAINTKTTYEDENKDFQLKDEDLPF